MATINPYLQYPGTTEEAFNFYKSVFGGELVWMQKFKDTPQVRDVPEEAKDKIMHAALSFGNGNTFMATDAIESMGHKLNVGNNFYLAVEAESKDQADKFFNGISSGGKVTMPLADTFWGSYFGMANDKFGVQWMISYTNRQPK